jgi:hypothetical protein
MSIRIGATVILEWHELTISQQNPYTEKAHYLIEKGYVEDIGEEELGKKIYMREQEAEQ